jgi:hypothetical protein
MAGILPTPAVPLRIVTIRFGDGQRELRGVGRIGREMMVTSQRTLA